MNHIQLQQALDAFATLTKEAWRDRNITDRRVRLSRLRRLYDRTVVEIGNAYPIKHERKPKPRPSDLHAALLAKGWVDVSHQTSTFGNERERIQRALALLGSKTVLRGWRRHYTSGALTYQLAAAPKWAYVVAKYAPERLKELFAAKQMKRDAVTFQLEAQHAPKKATP